MDECEVDIQCYNVTAYSYCNENENNSKTCYCKEEYVIDDGKCARKGDYSS